MRGPRGCLLGNPNTPPLTRPGWAEIHDVGRSFHSASYTLTVLRRQPKPHCRVPCGPCASWTCRRLISAVEISQRAVGRALSLPASERKAAGSTTWQHTPCVTACPRQEGSLRPRRKGGTHRCCGGWRGPGSPSPSGAELQALPVCSCSGCALCKNSWQSAAAKLQAGETRCPPEEGAVSGFTHRPGRSLADSCLVRCFLSSETGFLCSVL